MKKIIVFILGITLGFFVGVFSILLWQEYSNRNSNVNSGKSENVTIDTGTGSEVTGNNEIVVNETVAEKISEEMNGIFSNTYYMSQLLEFQKHGKQISEKSFKVFQVLRNGQALVYGKDEYGYYGGVIYLLIDRSDSDMYDDQIIKVPKGKIVKMNGTYRYTTRNGIEKTVPQIMILEAN